MVAALAAVAALVLVLTRPDGGGGGASQRAEAEVFLQPAAASGQDPFTESTAAEQATPPPESPPPGTATPTGPTGTRSVSGSAPGLYGGTKDVASCDVEKQIAALTAQPAKNVAFASALGIRPAAVPGHLRALTPVQLRTDTRVTNHGYRDGRATAYQAVLQAGTAVLVDDRGVPRVRCACGNPLGPPVALKADPKRFGKPWASYRPTQVVVIAPSVTVVRKFVIYDHHDRRWLERDRGTDPEPDKPVAPPVAPPPVVPPPPPVFVPPSEATPSVTTPPPSAPAPETGTPTATGTPTDTGTATRSSKPPAPPDKRTATPSGPATSSPPPSSPAASPATPGGGPRSPRP
ncbi:DUF6777 domain-containing protein [Streptomyces sp. NBC_00091]|uniref:DUF6777 domain-containing protein n=1 Tax=Streptomyces sp. NBC_00091 TaxID=2975648 RepID=UPI002253F780|nr:DUF6777 domain-containing protein [Streptomyces sp. NBC_00091]MCX5379898.1 hypothetical protein [Streptomyces sp. NBC_00091]